MKLAHTIKDAQYLLNRTWKGETYPGMNVNVCVRVSEVEYNNS